MPWFPGAIRKPITRHDTPMKRYRGVCYHTAVSESPSLYSYFNVPGNPTSHLYVRRDGQVEQYVDTLYRAPAQLEGNDSMIGVETQGGVRDADTERWSLEQMETLAQIAAWCAWVHGVPLRLMTNSAPATSGIGYHRLGIDPWRVTGGERWSLTAGKVCPGGGKIAQMTDVLERALEVFNQEDDVPLTKADAKLVIDELMSRAMSNGQTFGGNITTGYGRLEFLYNGVIEGGKLDSQLDRIEVLAGAIAAKVEAAEGHVDVEKLNLALNALVEAETALRAGLEGLGN